MKNKFNLLPVFSILLFFASCVKDTDFDQADDIVITPVLEVDFVFFTLDASDYVDPDSGDFRLMVSDTTNLNFLDGTFVQEDLKRAEFTFNFTNGINQNFNTEFRFLNDNDQVRYEFTIPVASGSVNSPVITNHIENIENEGIIELTKATKVVINVITPTSLENQGGTLNLQSKTTYFLEI